MNVSPRERLDADQWVETKISEGKARAREVQADVESMIVRRPLGAVGIAFAVGYLARSLPLPRVAAAAVRLGLSFAPHALLALGAARAWHCLREEQEQGRLGSLPKVGGREASAPGVTVFPGG
ncbi:hypothetical protein [Luteolibacter luteus]|uniref:DUF3618 domain-containing protein n=1 Tax=Luteolibacter luteus TaxID=2728835 RepID=A0A858RJP5_9BACT|nr:hypothetical protein [Luteolibacter luteus]QJE97082.1 hypothetical protein HHL09_15230 [Luteolibacter luteus]